MARCLDCENYRAKTSRQKLDPSMPDFVPDGWGECHEDSPKTTAILDVRWPPVNPEESCGRFAEKVRP